MPKEVELEGTPAEATWAMITVLVVVIVVLIFCCLVPFYRALEKRYHHWENEENDPRWDNDQFQFSPTSPRLERSASNSNYNRLSVCSGEGSSGTTSTLNVNNIFKNQSLLPRFEDQVEFKLPKKFHDGFNSGSIEEEGNQESSPSLKSYDHQPVKSSSVKKFSKTARKAIEPSPLSLPRLDHTKETQNSQILPKKPAEQKVQASVEKEPKKTRQQDLDARLAQLQAKKAASATLKSAVPEPAPAPVAPPKRNSKLMTPSAPGRARSGAGGSSEVTVSPPAPARKTNRK